MPLHERIVYGVLATLPLVCWPNLEHPFSTPKLWLLVLADLAIAVTYLAGRRKHAISWPPLSWAAAVSVSAVLSPRPEFTALLGTLVALPLFWAGERALKALWWGSLAESGIVVLQWTGLDPLKLLGWHAEAFANPRMRAYGTLGNPDFVAAWCCATLPLTWRIDGRKRWAALALQLAAILATGSRVLLLVLPVQAVILLLWRPRPARAWIAVSAAAASVLLLFPARPLGATIEGRLYLARVSATQWREMRITGFGPGSFETQFAHWQTREPSSRFAGPVDHAHNDYLEFAVEYGPLGLAVFLGLCGWGLASAWRARREYAPVAAGIASLLVIALVDFPFHRPAEWALFWILTGTLAATRGKTNQVTEING
jgi:O-antigen ligase